jgi:hypothetical protein
VALAADPSVAPIYLERSLSSFLTTKKKVDPKTAQTTLRQSNAAFTLSRYTQTDSDELLAAQQMMVDAIFGAAGTAIQ